MTYIQHQGLTKITARETSASIQCLQTWVHSFDIIISDEVENIFHFHILFDTLIKGAAIVTVIITITTVICVVTQQISICGVQNVNQLLRHNVSFYTFYLEPG